MITLYYLEMFADTLATAWDSFYQRLAEYFISFLSALFSFGFA